MSKEKETEKIINEKLNSREFAFDEKAWAGMETLLDAQQKKRRFGFWWYFSASMFVALVAGATWFLNSPQDLKGDIDLEKSETVFNKSNIALEKSETVSEKNNTVFNKNKTVLDKNNIALEKSKTALNENETVSEKSNIAFNKSKTTLNKNETALEKNKTVSEKSETVLNENETDLEKSNTVSEKSKTALNENETVLDKNNIASEKSEIVLNESEVILKPNNTFSAEISADSAKTTEQPLLTDSASLAETAKNPLTAPGKETKNAWGVLAGVGYWFPYQSTLGATDTKGVIGFTGGIYYQIAFSKRIELGLSALYSNRGALNYDKTFTNSNYGFGIESDITTISPQTLHYLNVPLHIRFNISQRSHIIIGASYYQLLATTSKVTHTIESSFATTLTSSEKQTGEHKGFRKNDIAAFIGYELTLFDRMNAGLQFSYGLYDNTLDAYHPDYSGCVDHNISLQLQLKYDLIRH